MENQCFHCSAELDLLMTNVTLFCDLKRLEKGCQSGQGACLGSQPGLRGSGKPQ